MKIIIFLKFYNKPVCEEKLKLLLFIKFLYVYNKNNNTHYNGYVTMRKDNRFEKQTFVFKQILRVKIKVSKQTTDTYYTYVLHRDD